MKRIRATFASLALLGALVGAGCGDLGSFVYFLMPEQKLPAEIKHLGTSEKSKDVKALILVLPFPLEIRPEFIGGGRELAVRLHKQLKELCEYNDEKLTLIAPEKVDAFKSSRPNWHELRPDDIGRHFQVDYVILLDVDNLT